MSDDPLKEVKKDTEDLSIALMRITSVLSRSKYKNANLDTALLRRVRRDLENLISHQDRILRNIRSSEITKTQPKNDKEKK